MHLLFAATWLVRRPVGVRMRDIFNSELDNQPENLCISDFRSVVPNDTAHAHQTASVIPLAVGTLLVNPS